MAKYCRECGYNSFVKMLAYLLPFRFCVKCGYHAGFCWYIYRILFVPVESFFGGGSVYLLGYDEGVNYFSAVKTYLTGGHND